MEDKNDDNNVYLYKAILIGDSYVGKTSLIVRFCDNKFDECGTSTVGIDTKTMFLKRNNKKIELQIWDTAGQERFKSLAKNCTNQMDGIILVYDISNQQSFKSIKTWYKNLLETVNFNKVGLILVGNKSDKEIREVDDNEVKKFCEQNKLSLIESSARTNKNVKEIYTSLIDIMLKLSNKEPSSERKSDKIEKSNHQKETDLKKKKLNCC